MRGTKVDDREELVSRLAAQGLTFGPPPAWVIEHDVPIASEGDASVRYLLSDTQIDITGEHVASRRVISQATNSAGIDAIASFTASYLPSFQKLIIHRVRLIRAGTAIDLADPERFQLLRREPNLERRIYDGALTADMQLSDVRPGDALETWFTVVGSNPSLKGAFDVSLALAFGVPVEQTFARVRAPTGRKLSIEILPANSECEFAETTPETGVTDREWRVLREPPFTYDESTPPWWANHKRINIEDDMSWGDVADLFRDGYAAPDQLPKDVEDEIHRINQLSVRPGERAIEALRFVQSSIRYLAVSMGQGGFLPREVEQIWATRFGDCKDVSRLLVSMLARLGVTSCPALVSTLGKDPDRKPKAHVYAFDHCIVRAEIQGVVRWLDATVFASGGDFERVSQPDLGWALPLIENADIEKLPESGAALAVLDSRERITFGGRASAPIELQAETIHRDWKADQLRANIRREGAQAVSEHRRKYFDQAYNGAQIASPMEIDDDIDANEITLVERYTLENAWSTDNNVAHFTQADTITPDLQVLPQSGRKQPLWLGLPRRFRRITHFIAPVSWPLAPWDLRADAVGIRGFSTFATSLHSSKEFQLEFDYAITRASIQSEHFDEFPGEYVKLRRGVALSLSIPLSDDAPKVKESEELSPNALGILVIIGVLLLGAVIIAIMRGI